VSATSSLICYVPYLGIEKAHRNKVGAHFPRNFLSGKIFSMEEKDKQQ
jgi:hypothetical protein